MKLALAGPGFAFWRAKEHGWDLWEYGLIEILAEDWWHWTLGLGVFDLDMAAGAHFDHYRTLRLWLGPFEINLLYITDLKN